MVGQRALAMKQTTENHLFSSQVCIGSVWLVLQARVSPAGLAPRCSLQAAGRWLGQAEFSLHGPSSSQRARVAVC